MRKLAFCGALAVVALSGLLAYPLAVAGTQRGDCPGTIVCPLTGNEVCKDQCPLSAKKTDSTRADCPGQIECPLTGELICRDKCPAAATAKAAAVTQEVATTEVVDLPPCCRKAKK